MNQNQLEQRTKNFALGVIRFVSDLPGNRINETLGNQLLRSGTSIGANYREANRAESKADFIHKISIVEKESSETQYWLTLMDESNIGLAEARKALLLESSELLAIFTSTRKTSRMRYGKP